MEELLSFSWLEADRLASIEEEHRVFARLLIAGTIENIVEVDGAIKAQLQNWSFERLKRVDLAILRIGAYSLMFQRDIPVQITIDEAIEIAKEYGSDEAYRFVNGVLDGIRKAREA